MIIVKRIRASLFYLLGLMKIRLIDPIEVFYIKDIETFYPIISKSGCSSVKYDLIKMYNSDFRSKFPDIHLLDPLEVTNNKIERKFFYTKKSYRKFCKNKNLVLVIRNPFERLNSCYNGIIQKKNTMYKTPSGMNFILNFDTSISIIDFIQKIKKIPNYLSDRHFRSQSFYFSDSIKQIVKKYYIIEIGSNIFPNDLFNVHPADKSRIILNKNIEVNKTQNIEILEGSSDIKKRYNKDIKLYNSVKNHEFAP